VAGVIWHMITTNCWLMNFKYPQSPGHSAPLVTVRFACSETAVNDSRPHQSLYALFMTLLISLKQLHLALRLFRALTCKEGVPCRDINCCIVRSFQFTLGSCNPNPEHLCSKRPGNKYSRFHSVPRIWGAGQQTAVHGCLPTYTRDR
jgi:hypothetical protein